MQLVFLVEEPSMKYLLQSILPRILPKEISYYVIGHQGKADLLRSIPIKLRGWNTPDTRFVIIHDQDTRDCVELKQELKRLCEPYHRDVLIRIPCRELESWYFGDMKAVSAAYGRDYTKIAAKRRYREPDRIPDPKAELYKLLPCHEQISGAKKIGPLMDIDANTSTSFQIFVEGIRKFTALGSF